MAAYRADIEIAVKGGRQLAEVSERIGQLSKQINDVNKAAKLQGAIPASVNNYRSAVEQANAAVRASAAGTTTQKRAIDLYVKSLAQAEKAELNLANAIEKRQRELNLGTAATGARGGQGRFAGVASNAIIGGAFPLLFGQGAGAATGGAIGGAVGSLFGGTGGFAGSLLGTVIGDLASQANQVKSLGTDIGFSVQQTQQLAAAFKQAGTDFDKFQDSVQNIRGLGLSLEDQATAVRLVSTLTDTYGGKIDKITNAFTSALESGKVTQATLNQLTSQGIPIQDELAKKYGVSRDSLLQMTKDGEISVQSLADALVSMGNKGLEAGEKPRTAFENFTLALNNTGTAIGNVANTLLTVLSPAIDTIILQATQALNILTETINTELLRTKIQKQSGKILSPAKLKEIEDTATSMAATRYPSEAKGRQLAAGPKILSPRAQAEFQVLREQMIRNELKSFGYESGILTPPKPTVTTEISRITAPSQLPPSGAKSDSDKAARNAARLAEQRQKQLEAAARMAVLTEGELQKAVAVTEQEKLNTDYAQQRMERMVKYETLYKEALSNAEIEYLLMAQSNEILAENYKYQKDLLDIALQQSQVINKADPLASAQQELELLRAKIQGTEKEYLIQKQINDLIKQNADPEDARGLILTIQDLEKQNKAIETQKQLWADIYTTVSGEIQNAITGLIEGTAQWGDVLSSILSGLGNLFLNAAFTGLGGALKLPGFASGGFVTRPTTAVVGEGGEPEYVIPASKMRSAMGRYASGARGSNVLSAGGDTGEMGGAATMAPAAIDVRYSVERINNVDYVTADQFQAGMAQAAQQGAIQGERRAMRTLTNSAAARGRLRI